MTTQIVRRMRERDTAVAKREAWRKQVARDRAAQEAERIEDITRAVVRTLQQTRLERAAAYFRAVFK